MNEHPIIFQGWKVRKILDWDWSLGNMQTRRVVVPKPFMWAERFERAPFDFGNGAYGQKGDWIQMSKDAEHMRGMGKCRYGAPGDRLWVRETFSVICREALPTCECETEQERDKNHYYEYRADTEAPYPGDWPEDEARGNGDAPKWSPSIHMRKRAARIWLEVVDVRIERVQEINPTDVIAEGIERAQDGSWLGPLDGYPGFPYAHAHEAYAGLWDQLNSERGYGWNVNPWVWVVTYRAVAQPSFRPSP
jgi:hypothetical protein